MKSMTGFGRGSAAGENYSVAVDLKTVNNRFLDVHLRMGAELSSLEAVVKRRIGARLSRGRVDASITFERTGEPDINILARLPGAMQPLKDGLDEQMLAGVVNAVDEALNELEQMRER